MASTSIKSTYSLDVQTVRQLEAMARRWNVSKSEALRRAIRTAAAQEPPEADALKALDDLQASLSLTDEAASEWLDQVSSERRATGHRTGSQAP
jgi:predicted transcriptional regulator